MKGVRVAYFAESEIANFHPDTKKSFFDAVKVVEGLGARVQPVTFPQRMKAAGASHGIIRISEASAYHREFLRTRASEYKTADSDVRTTVEAGSLLTASQYMNAQRARTIFMREMARAFEQFDVMLSPTMPAPADVEVQVPETFRTGGTCAAIQRSRCPAASR